MCGGGQVVCESLHARLSPTGCPLTRSNEVTLTLLMHCVCQMVVACMFICDIWALRYHEMVTFVVLDQVRHFRPILIHRFFAVYRYRSDTDTLQEQPCNVM